jgi:hypothetical protein
MDSRVKLTKFEASSPDVVEETAKIQQEAAAST